MNLRLRSRSTLATVAQNPPLRANTKRALPGDCQFYAMVYCANTLSLNGFLPDPFVKCVQPSHLTDDQENGAAAISSLAERRFGAYRQISSEAFESIFPNRKLRNGAVLVAMD